MRESNIRCQLCMHEILPEDAVILTKLYNVIHEDCSEENSYGKIDKGIFFEVAGRNFAYFQEFVIKFYKMGLYKKDEAPTQ
ncbi:hypothetical protein [Robertmurraya kyonggiensis]|uniref:Uncharacterized protein n=1 Tax=Robertmurraya kyonggiensis TaxID=1037680 RepID=A0A4U1D1J4_9BACI|nr:hypothetical protein [Robertmurraya kyonggiensis]TKC15668.1 hypothetical protein FA727_16205 [Robertmurraya kyonggiensis]